MFAQAGSHAYNLPDNRSNWNVSYFCCGALLIFTGTILLAALGLFVMFPYAATRDWLETTCNVTYAGVSTRLCACDKELAQAPGCPDTHPCLQVFVTHPYLPNDTVSAMQRGTTNQTVTADLDDRLAINTDAYQFPSKVALLPNNGSLQATGDASEKLLYTNKQLEQHEAKHANVKYHSKTPLLLDRNNNKEVHEENIPGTLLFRAWKDIYFKECTLQECGDKDWNTQSARRFLDDYGAPSQQLACFVDRAAPASVVLQRVPLASFLHALLWPLVCILLGAAIWALLFTGCFSTDNMDSDCFSRD